MKPTVIAVRLLLGAWLTFNGVSYWLPNMPMGHKPVAIALMHSLIDTHIMLLVKLVELVVGLALLAGTYVPLALVVGFPIVLMVAYVCLVVEWPLQRPMIGGAATLAAHVFLLFAYLDRYRPMLAFRATTSKPAAL